MIGRHGSLPCPTSTKQVSRSGQGDEASASMGDPEPSRHSLYTHLVIYQIVSQILKKRARTGPPEPPHGPDLRHRRGRGSPHFRGPWQDQTRHIDNGCLKCFLILHSARIGAGRTRSTLTAARLGVAPTRTPNLRYWRALFASISLISTCLSLCDSGTAQRGPSGSVLVLARRTAPRSFPRATQEHADIEVESEVPEGLLFIQPLPVSGRSS